MPVIAVLNEKLGMEVLCEETISCVPYKSSSANLWKFAGAAWKTKGIIQHLSGPLGTY